MYDVAAFYRFTPLSDLPAVQAGLRAALEPLGVRGTVLVAPEGINGTVSIRDGLTDEAFEALHAVPGCAGIEPRLSRAETQPFNRLKVRLKKEIVTLGHPVDPNATVGERVAPEDWNALIAAPDVVTIDTRNDYEVEIGSFRGAVDPGTKAFGDFPSWWEANRAALEGKRIAMFCTGGIRCEKSTSFLKSQGVEDVYHLNGGILNYLETVPQDQSLWEGSCFVFDGRVSVGHGLEEGPHLLCHGCRMPLRPEDADRVGYERGVSCHHCHDRTSEADKERFRMRQSQMAR